MTNAELAAVHAAAMTVPRPWAAHEIGALRLMPGVVEIARAEGFALGRVTLDEAELLTIAVRPDSQGAGIGRSILDTFHDAARARGATLCHLEVSAGNVAARALYTAAGYEPTGLRRGYYAEVRPAEDAITMSRPL